MLLWMDYFIYLCRDSNPPRYPQQQQQQQPSRPKINGSEMSLNRQKSIKDLNWEKNVFFKLLLYQDLTACFRTLSHILSRSHSLSQTISLFLTHSLWCQPASETSTDLDWSSKSHKSLMESGSSQTNNSFHSDYYPISAQLSSQVAILWDFRVSETKLK